MTRFNRVVSEADKLHHAAALWTLRTHPALHAAFSALHGTESLWVSFDRVSLKARREEASLPGLASPLHWDGEYGDSAEAKLVLRRAVVCGQHAIA